MTKKQFFIGIYVCLFLLGLSMCMSVSALFIVIRNDNSRRAVASDTQQKLSEFQSKLNGIKSNIDDLGKNVISLDALSNAIFSPTTTGFQSILVSGISAPYAYVLVKLTGIEKFGDGYKVTFAFGNPTSIAFGGLNGTIRWGNQKKDFHILSPLEPGAWNEVSITIGPAKEEDIGMIALGDLNTDKVINMRTVRLAN